MKIHSEKIKANDKFHEKYSGFVDSEFVKTCDELVIGPDLRFGSLSIRKFYWGLMDAFKKSQKGTKKPFNPQIVVQLLWREFFYTMSVNNQHFGEMDQNKICINIDWYPITDNNNFSAFTQAKTGYPLIDAGVRQLLKEGWVHHIIRYVDFLTEFEKKIQIKAMIALITKMALIVYETC